MFNLINSVQRENVPSRRRDVTIDDGLNSVNVRESILPFLLLVLSRVGRLGLMFDAHVSDSLSTLFRSRCRAFATGHIICDM